jgi:hypothetical protein
MPASLPQVEKEAAARVAAAEKNRDEGVLQAKQEAMAAVRMQFNGCSTLSRVMGMCAVTSLPRADRLGQAAGSPQHGGGGAGRGGTRRCYDHRCQGAISLLCGLVVLQFKIRLVE